MYIVSIRSRSWRVGFIAALAALLACVSVGVVGGEGNGLRNSDSPSVCDEERRGDYERINYGGSIWFVQHCGGMGVRVTDRSGRPFDSDAPAPGVLFRLASGNRLIFDGVYKGDTWRGLLSGGPEGPLTYYGSAVRNGTAAWTSDDGRHRVVLGDDGQYYREERVGGRWVRSVSYGTGADALENARRNIRSLSEGRGLTVALSPTPVKLVGNTSQPDHGTGESLIRDVAQGFTTGSNAKGYRLTAVKIRIFKGSPATPAYRVTIQGADASNEPNGVVLGTLTRPTLLPNHKTNVTFTASGDGIDLTRHTTYFVVWDILASATGSGTIVVTHTNNEDANAAPGWSISDFGLTKEWDGTFWDSPKANERQIEIYGYAKTY